LSGREDEEAQQQNQYSFSHSFSFSAADIYCRPDSIGRSVRHPGTGKFPGVNTDERNYPQTSTEKSTKLVTICNHHSPCPLAVLVNVAGSKGWLESPPDVAGRDLATKPRGGTMAESTSKLTVSGGDPQKLAEMTALHAIKRFKMLLTMFKAKVA
jgi:hypothetical protein